MDPILVGALLVALLLALVGALVWQEARKRPADEQAVYVIEDAARFIFPLLADASMERLDLDDVRRILEWEVLYLQGVGATKTGPARPAPVAGGSDDAIRFIAARLVANGVPRYLEEDIREVLSHEPAYLVEIGAVGDPAGWTPA